MANPVSGPPNGSPPNPDQPPQDNAGGRIGSIFRRIFSSHGQAPQPPAPLSSRENQLAGVSVSAGGIDLSDKEAVKKELKAWRRSLPFWGIGSDAADRIIEYLLSEDLTQPFTLSLERFSMGDRASFKSLPNVLQNCTSLDCRGCTSLETLPKLPACTWLNCYNCTSLQALPELPVCEKLNCDDCPQLRSIPELPLCTELNCSNCPSLETLPELRKCIRLYCSGCTSLQKLPELPVCQKLYCRGLKKLETLPALPLCIELALDNCTSLRALPELPSLKKLEISLCSELRYLPALKGLTFFDYVGAYICKVKEIMETVATSLGQIDGVTYFPKALPAELQALLTPALPDGASIEHLEYDLQRFIDGLKESDLPKLKEEIQGEQDLESYKQKLTEWKGLLFSRVRKQEAYFGTPRAGTEELNQFYNQIELYLVHLGAFLSKEENQDAFFERLQILQSQDWCGARFIAELEQLFSLTCIDTENASISNQFAQIASSQAKLTIEQMYPDGNVHKINQAMFQLREYLTGTYQKDTLIRRPFKQLDLLKDFLQHNTSTNLVETIQASLKPGYPMEKLFTDYLKENFSHELDKDQLREVKQDLRDLWKLKTKSKIEAFIKYDQLRKIKAEDRTDEQSLEIIRLPLSEQEKSCVSEFEYSLLLGEMEEGFKNVNLKNFVQSKKDEILYQNHYDEQANKWKPGIIAKALQKMGILVTIEEVIPKRS